MLKEIAVSAISRIEDFNETIHVIVDYRVGIYALSMLISAMLPTRCPMVLRRYVCNQHNALNDCAVEHGVTGITARMCTSLENSGNLLSNRSSLCIVSSISETVI